MSGISNEQQPTARKDHRCTASELVRAHFDEEDLKLEISEEQYHRGIVHKEKNYLIKKGDTYRSYDYYEPTEREFFKCKESLIAAEICQQFQLWEI